MLQQLQRATNELYASVSVQESISITVETAIDILGFDWCVVTRADHDSGMFEVVATAGDTRLEVGDRPLGIEEGVVGEVYRNGESTRIDDVEATDRGDPIDGGFAVEDDGPGVNVDQPFEHGHSGDDGGTGLGLAITREIVEAHGWEITATAGAAGGARFEITGVEGAHDR